jgi:DoxX-like family
MKFFKYFYWVVTIIFCILMLLDGVGGVTRQEAGVKVLEHLGYPIYLMNILGVAKILGVITILYNKLTFLKEWAYAGFTFTAIGAFASRVYVGDKGLDLYFPLIYLAIVLISYVVWKINEVNFLFQE